MHAARYDPYSSLVSGPRVALFVTCLVNVFRPAVAEASVRLLRAAGCTVEVPLAQTCCGQPGYNAGDVDGTRPLARRTIALINRKTDGASWTAPIVLLGVFATALFYGDSMITPAMSMMAILSSAYLVPEWCFSVTPSWVWK